MSLAVATLTVGPVSKTAQATIYKIQSLFCENKPACMSCITCTSIKQKNFHSLLWITPEQRYTLDDIAPIFKRSDFILGDNQSMVFVLEHADRLTSATANALLKLVEEPPTGYYFFFTAQRAVHVLPTIRSRCHVHTITTPVTQELQPFEQFFMAQAPSAQGFYSYLTTHCPSEIETPTVVDALLEAWIKRYQEAILQADTQQQETCSHMITLLRKALEQPPMPGSAKLFWKNLFLQRERHS